MTNILRRADRPIEAAELARASARRLARRRTGRSAEASGEDQIAALRRIGVSEPEAHLITDERALAAEDLLTLAAALAHLAPGASRGGGAATERSR
jgi:hypothetical protein